MSGVDRFIRLFDVVDSSSQYSDEGSLLRREPGVCLEVSAGDEIGSGNGAGNGFPNKTKLGEKDDMGS